MATLSMGHPDPTLAGSDDISGAPESGAAYSGWTGLALARVQRHEDVPVLISIDRTVRAKIIDACGMTCTFCHNEGTPVAIDNLNRGDARPTAAGRSGRVSIYASGNGVRFLPATMAPDRAFAGALAMLRHGVGAEELHLTGGEPTLHPQLPEVISAACRSGYRVCMTSNGENGSRVLPACAEAGLDRVNFSVFGTTAQELAQVQHPKYRDSALARRKIDALHRSVSTAIRHGIGASANIVVPHYGHAPRVRRIPARIWLGPLGAAPQLPR